MATTLNMTLLLRRAAFADSCVLQAGEPGYHITTKEFKIGDGITTWENLPIANKTQIEALISAAISAHAAGYYTKTEVDSFIETVTTAASNASTAVTAEAQAREAADAQIRTDFAAADTTTLNSAKSYADTKKTEVIGTSSNASTADTIYGAKKHAEEKASAAQSAAISAAATDATTKANTAESNAKSYAETKATAAETAAKNYADSQDTALETSLIGGDTDATYAKTIKGAKDFATAKATAAQTAAESYADGIVATEKTSRENADTALGNRITTVENKLANVSNVMDFVGAKTTLPAEGSNQSGDVIVITEGDDAGKEFVYDNSRPTGQKWVEFGSTSATDSAVAALKSRMDAAEEDIGDNASAITALGTNKLDKSVYDAYINGKSMSDAELKSYADNKASAAQSAAITKAGELDAALHTTISKEIDDDVAAAISAEVTRSNDYADSAEADAISTAAAQAEAKDAARYTTVTNDIATAKSEAITSAKNAVIGATTDASSANTIYGAKKHAEEKANDAKTAVIGASGDAKTANTVYGAKAFATDAANTAKTNAINTVIGTADDGADTDTINGVRKAFAAADTTVLNTAKTYAETQVTNAHKDYKTATVKDAAHDSATDPSFITSITIDKGHVTGATVQNLASVLAAMEFIFDGGTSAT